MSKIVQSHTSYSLHGCRASFVDTAGSVPLVWMTDCWPVGYSNIKIRFGRKNISADKERTGNYYPQKRISGSKTSSGRAKIAIYMFNTNAAQLFGTMYSVLLKAVVHKSSKQQLRHSRALHLSKRRCRLPALPSTFSSSTWECEYQSCELKA